MSLDIVALHLGALHPYEKVLTLLLAFGPFVVLGVLVAVRRKHDLAEERAESEVNGSATSGRPGSPSGRP